MDIFRKGTRLKALTLLGIIFFLLNSGLCLGAEDPVKFPSKPITAILQFGAGGVTDILLRRLTDAASKKIGQPILLENKAAGAGVLATTTIATAPPDGYTVGTVSYSSTTVIPHLRSVPYNIKTDFTWILQFSEYGESFFCVRADSPWKTFREFVEEARRNPGKLTFSTPGAMSQNHVEFEYIFSKVEKVKVNHVPSSGAAEAATQLLGGHITAASGSGMRQYVEAGKLRLLAIHAGERMKEFPDVPTLNEMYNMNMPLWLGLAGPKGIDPLIHKKLRDTFKACYDDPDFKAFSLKIGMTPVFRDSDPFKNMVFDQYELWGKMLKEIGFAK